MNDYLMIAAVLKPQGIHGECKLRSYASDIDMFRQWTTLYIKQGDSFSPVSVRTSRIHDGFVFARLNASLSADEAERFRGKELYIDRDHAAPAEDGAVLIADLIGCEARDENGNAVGVLTDVLQYGTVDTWVFSTSAGTLMAPALKAVFPFVDPESRSIRVIADKLEEVAVRT